MSDSQSSRISIHSLRVEGDGIQISLFRRKLLFQSTPSEWRETLCCNLGRVSRRYFNPLPPSGGRRLFFCAKLLVGSDFNPLPPSGGRPTGDMYVLNSSGISIHSLRVEGDCKLAVSLASELISIHSLRVEGDCAKGCTSPHDIIISIHSLRVEGDVRLYHCSFRGKIFQSTPSEWRETN